MAHTNAEDQDEVDNSNNEAERVEDKKRITILYYVIPTVILIALVLAAALIK